MVVLPDSQLIDLVKKEAGNFSLDHNLICAIIQKESGWKTYRTRYEPNWKRWVNPLSYSQHLGTTIETEVVHQSTSWGLGQVMGAVARESFFDGFMPELCNPEVGIHHSARKLFDFVKRYSSLNDAIASYNAGHPEWIDPQKSKYINQTYVTDVLRFMQEYKDLKI